MNNLPASSTSISDLPEEMFRNVFNKLSYNDMVNCSKVCVHWKNLIEELGEYFWMKKCSREYPDVSEDGHRTSGLSWRQLYHSLHRWEVINEIQDSSNADHFIIPHEQIGTVCLLENNIICYPIRHIVLLWSDRPRQYSKHKNHFHAVVYFDVMKCKTVNFKQFGVSFKNYRENDDILVIEIVRGNLHILRVFPKRCENEVTQRVIFDFMEECSWFVVNNDVYYQTKKDKVIMLHRLRVIQKDGRVRFENTALAQSNKREILAIVHFGNNIHLLKRRSKYMIYAVKVNEDALKRLYSCYTFNMSAKEIFQAFSRFGFYLSNPDLNRKILKMDSHRQLSQKIVNPEVVIPYGPHTMTFTCPTPWMVKFNIAPNDVPAHPQCLQIEIDPFSFPMLNMELIQILECASGHIILFGYRGCKVILDEISSKLILIFIKRT